MGFLKKLFSGPSPGLRNAMYPLKVKCDRCGEIVEGQINLANDLSLGDETSDGYFVRKMLMGSGRCFQQIEVELKFNAARKVTDQQISGGAFIEE